MSVSRCLCLFVCLPTCMPACLPVCLPACLSACLSVCPLSACFSAHSFIRLFACLQAQFCIQFFIYLFTLSLSDDNMDSSQTTDGWMVTDFVTNQSALYVTGLLPVVKSNASINITTYVLMALIGSIIVFLNAIIIHVHRNSKRLRSTNTFLFIASLAYADILLGALVPITKWANFAIRSLPRRDPKLDVFMWMLQYVPMTVSRVHLLVIAAERYLAAVFPIFHRNYISLRVCKVALAASWVICICIAGVPFFCHTSRRKGLIPWWFMMVAVIGHQIVIDGFLVFFYINIYRTISSLKNSGNAKDVRYHKKEMRLTKMIGLTFVLFEICWTPFIIVYIVRNAGRSLGFTYNKLFDTWLPPAQLLAACNSVVNVFIYAGIIPEFMAGVKNVIRRLLCLRQKIQPSGETSGNTASATDS